MMGLSVADAMAQLAATLTVELAPDVTVTTDVSVVPSVLPAVVISPPRLLFEGPPSANPTSMTLTLQVVVDVNPPDRALPQLWDLVPQVAAAADMTDGVVTQAVPGTFGVAGTVQLPAYDITIEVPL